MVGRVRTAFALGMTAAVTPLLAAAQFVVVRTGIAPVGRMPRAWFRFLARALGLKVIPFGNLAPARPLLIVANHVSWMDIVALGAIGEVSFVARGDMARWPLIGPLSKLGNTVFVDRAHRRGSAEQAGEIARQMAGGSAIVLFAEGTTGDGVRLRPFKSALFGAVEILLTTGSDVEALIQPVTIAYTRHHGVPMGRRHRMRAAWIGDEDLVPHVRDLLRRDVFDIEVHFGEPFALDDATDRKKAARRAESAIRDKLVETRRRQPD